MVDWSLYDPTQQQDKTGGTTPAPVQDQAPAASAPSGGGVDWGKYDPTQTKQSTTTPAPTTTTPTPQSQQKSGFLKSLLGYDPTNLNEVKQQFYEKNIKGPGDFAHNAVQGMVKSVLDALSGVDVARATKGTPVSEAATGFYNAFGKYLYSSVDKQKGLMGGIKLDTPEQQQAKKDITSNVSLWDRLGATFNVATTPFLLKDIVEAPLKEAGKSIPLPSIVSGTFSTINHVIPDFMTGGAGKFIQNTFGRFSNDSIAAHTQIAKDVIPTVSQGELASQEGRHVIDWVMQQAEKYHFSRGGDTVSKLSNSDILKSWSDAVNIWGTSIKEISKNMNDFRQTSDRVIGGIQEAAGKLGIDDTFLNNITLYKPDYLEQAKRAATKMGNDSPSLVDWLKANKDNLIKSVVSAGKEPPGKIIDNWIKAIKMVEKETGYKVAAGHDTFIDPKLFVDIPKEPPVAETAGKQGNVVTNTLKGLKGLFDPQYYTDDAKTSLIQAKLRMNLAKAGLDPLDVIDKMRKAQAGIPGAEKLTFSDANSLLKHGKFHQIFGEDANKIIKAAQDAGKIPFHITGVTTAGVARRIPVGSTLVQSLFGIRWGVNPLFQLTKLPTKLYELGLSLGIAPWSPEADAALGHYLETTGKPMVARMLSDIEIEMQYQSRGGYSAATKALIDGTKNDPSFGGKMLNKLGTFLDHITSADERVYLKGVYKYLADKGYDLSKVPVDQHLDFAKTNIPIDILGAADNYAKSITRYGQGTSPLQNTLNTILFPWMFHAKVGKYMISGMLRFPVATQAIASLVNVQNKWALSPEGQKWHQTPGWFQSMLHLAGSAEPINIPALTGRQESAQQAVGRFTKPYNPILSPLLQGAADITGAKIPGTQPPSSETEIKHPVAGVVAGLTGLGGVFTQSKSLGESLGLIKPPPQRSTKSIKQEAQRQAQGLPPQTKSLLASMRDFQGQDTLTDVQKLQYARMRANYDFPDDQVKQKKEIDTIMRLWRRVKPPKK